MSAPLARCIMVWGTASGVGKSWFVTALCRSFARRGLRVAPFKAQNMSNNARVVPMPGGGWGEIGSAQYLQALAAHAVPDVRMNPVLLKPESNTRSQVVLGGLVNTVLSDMPWRQRSQAVWPHVAQALDSLRADVDLIVMEGAGSPAEINLMPSDVVNLRVAEHAHARAILVADIDRGGAFAHLYGTWALLPESHRQRLMGFVLNKFRGDARLLEPGPAMLQERTGVPIVATVPMWRDHGLPEEDAWFDERPSSHDSNDAPVLAIVAAPRISNLDEFEALRRLPNLRLVWARSPSDLDGARWVVLPGSKHTSSDLAWMRERGLDAAVARHAQAGGAVLGICGGLQMLGEALIDPHGIDGNAPGLGLLPLVTRFERDKQVRPRTAAFEPTLPPGPWQALAGLAVQAYEIHHGQTVQHPAMAARGDIAQPVLQDGLGWSNAQGNVPVSYTHLDVYKRQGAWRAADLAPAAGGGDRGCGAVSGT